MQGWFFTHNTHMLFAHHSLSFGNAISISTLPGPSFSVSRSKKQWRVTYPKTGKYIAQGTSRHDAVTRAIQVLDNTPSLKLSEFVLTAMAEVTDLEPVGYLPLSGKPETICILDTRDALFNDDSTRNYEER
jgi:hypothetical protein